MGAGRKPDGLPIDVKIKGYGLVYRPDGRIRVDVPKRLRPDPEEMQRLSTMTPMTVEGDDGGDS